MTPRRNINVMLVCTFVLWMGQRVTAVALPLVALTETGSTWTTGLVGGAAGLPLITSGWWAARLRALITSGPTLALVLAVQCLGLLIVPVGALTPAGVTAYHLASAGLVIGAATAVGGPGQRALIADIADDLGPMASVKALAWQDFAHRVTMFLGPPLGGLGVATLGAVPLLWAEATAVLLGALLLATVRHSATAPTAPTAPTARTAPSAPTANPHRTTMREVLARHTDIRTAFVLAGIGGFVWFAFTLGLTILGAQIGKPGELVAAGLTGYGIGSTAAAMTASKVVPRLPLMETICVSWVVLGASFALLVTVSPSLLGIGLIAALGGVAMPLGIGALNALITTGTSGDERRTAFAAETVIHDGAVAVGLTTGGALIGLLGVPTVLVLTGAIQCLAGGAVLVRRLLTRTPDRHREPADIALSRQA